MKQTENYNFSKPEENDFFNIEHQNVNWDAADAKIKQLEVAVDGTAAANHTHDDRYYTDVEVDTLLSNKASGDHIQALDKGGTGAKTATEARTNLGLGAAATKGVDTSITAGSTNLPTSGAVKSALDDKANSSHSHSYAGASTAGGEATSAAKATNDGNGNSIVNTYAPKASPAFTGTPTVAANTNYTTAMVRNVAFTTADPGAGTASSLPNGSVLIVYE